MTIPNDDPFLDEETERELAKRLFNGVWELLEQGERGPEEDELMLDAAHASLYHWMRVAKKIWKFCC